MYKTPFSPKHHQYFLLMRKRARSDGPVTLFVCPEEILGKYDRKRSKFEDDDRHSRVRSADDILESFIAVWDTLTASKGTEEKEEEQPPFIQINNEPQYMRMIGGEYGNTPTPFVPEKKYNDDLLFRILSDLEPQGICPADQSEFAALFVKADFMNPLVAFELVRNHPDYEIKGKWWFSVQFRYSHYISAYGPLPNIMKIMMPFTVLYKTYPKFGQQLLDRMITLGLSCDDLKQDEFVAKLKEVLDAISYVPAFIKTLPVDVAQLHADTALMRLSRAFDDVAPEDRATYVKECLAAIRSIVDAVE